MERGERSDFGGEKREERGERSDFGGEWRVESGERSDFGGEKREESGERDDLSGEWIVESGERNVLDLQNNTQGEKLSSLHSPLSTIHQKNVSSLHASTQMDNRTAEKVAWLRDLGFEQVVLARELTLEEIREIHEKVPDVKLEVFVHGAICVSYNGQCYASQYCFGRSANRGECAQFCRMPFDLIEVRDDFSGEWRVESGERSDFGGEWRVESGERSDLSGEWRVESGERSDLSGEWRVESGERDGERVLLRQKHLLSLRDMNRSAELEALLDAGVTSLKIEGRLKDVSYVKNVVAYYRQRLDEIIRRRPDEYRRSSLGHEVITFTPNPAKSFNRLFTNYFLFGRTPNMANIYTPKSMGEIVEGELHNGDGLCYLNDEGQLVGFRVNRVEGDKIHLANGTVLPLHEGIRGKHLYRNYDLQFEQQLSKPTATRKIRVCWLLKEVPEGFLLRLTREDGAMTERIFPYPHELARSPQKEQIERQLSRLGDTPYEATGVDIDMSQDWFIPSSVLAEWRRQQTLPQPHPCREGGSYIIPLIGSSTYSPPCRGGTGGGSAVGRSLSYLANVSNHAARQFYIDHGAKQVDWAMEVAPKSAGDHPLIMTCRYCIRYELGMCKVHSQKERQYSPIMGGDGGGLFLRLADGRRFRLHFDCKKCQMEVYAE